MSIPTSPSAGSEGPGPDPDPALSHIESDIENTREELGETVEALTGKLDVKAQAEKKTEQLMSQVGSRFAAAKRALTSSRRLAFLAVGAVGAAALGVVIVRARRRHCSRPVS
jgi:Protein of unknown function (DUF3618)